MMRQQLKPNWKLPVPPQKSLNKFCRIDVRVFYGESISACKYY
jgi:hypothetical protein